MSLICVRCRKIIVMSQNPAHYGACYKCGVNLTLKEEKQIEESSRQFHKLSKQASERRNNGTDNH